MKVAQLWRYPVKSLQGEQVQRSIVTGVGLEWDRGIAVVRCDTSTALTGRREPKLLLLSASIAGARVVINGPDEAPLETDAELSEFLGYDVRLARPPLRDQPSFEYPLDPEFEEGRWGRWRGPTGVWHDSTRTQVSILSTTSTRDWPVRRFRPNLLVEGQEEKELVGRIIRIGSAVLDVRKRIDRCIVVTRQQPGIERDLEVLRTILRDEEGFLGIGALVVETGVIEVGDEIVDLGPSPVTPVQ